MWTETQLRLRSAARTLIVVSLAMIAIGLAQKAFAQPLDGPICKAPVQRAASPVDQMSGGYPGSKGHDAYHNWYSTLRRPDIGGSCCSGQDCAPTVARMVGDEVQVKLRGVWTRVPPEKIVKGAQPPDLGDHVCAPTDPSLFPKDYLFCVVLGGGV